MVAERTPRRTWVLASLIAAALVSSSAAHALAQRPAAPGVVVTGSVQDQTGGVLAGAEVVLADRAGQTLQTTKADSSGVFRFDGVPAGTYDIRAQYEGFRPQSKRVRVGDRPPGPQKLVLAIGGLEERVTVGTGDDGVSTGAGQNRDALVLDKRMLSDLPIFDRDLIAAASRLLDPAALATGGATLVVDGMEARKVGVSKSAIVQIRINQDPYAAEFARPGAGRIEVITKSGASAYHGEFNFTFRDAYLDARNVFAPTKPPEQRRIFDANLSGPIGDGKRSSFLLTVEREELDLQAIVYAQTPTGEVRQVVPTPQRNLSVSGSIDHSLGARNTITLRATYSTESNRNEGVGGTTLPEVGSDSSDQEEQIVYGHRTIFSSHVVNQFRLLIGHDRQPTVSLTPGQRLTVPDAFTSGGAQRDSLETELHFTLNNTVTWTSGKHVVKAGLAIPEWSQRGLNDWTSREGVFSFSSLADYTAGRPYLFVQQQGDGRLSFMQKMVGAFAQDEFAVRPNLSLSFGVRYDWLSFYGDSNNIVPRVSFAWSPRSDARTVIRGGMGMFYDRPEEGPIADVLRSSEGRLFRYVLTDPGYPDPLANGGALAAQPTSLVRFAPDLVIPFSLQFGVGVERQIVKGTTVAVNYTGSRGHQTFRSRDINAPPPPLYLDRPDPEHGVIRQAESAGRTRSDAVTFALRGRVTRFFNGSAQYSVGRLMNNTGGINWMPANNYDMSGEWSRADNDQRRRFDLIGTISPTRWMTIGMSLLVRSGRPYSLTTGRDEYNSGSTKARPPGVPRNSLVGPGSTTLDLRWSHGIPLSKDREEGPKLTVGVDAFNVLNTVNYSGYTGNMSSPFFGQATSAAPARRMQLSVRVEF